MANIGNQYQQVYPGEWDCMNNSSVQMDAMMQSAKRQKRQAIEKDT